MKKSTKGILLISITVFSLLAATLITLGVYSQIVKEVSPLRLGPEFDNMKYRLNPTGLETPVVSSMPQAAYDGYWEIGDTAYWLILNDYTGYYQWAVFELRGIGTLDLAELWVQLDLSYDPSSGRETDVITDEQVTYMLGEFENNIYPIEIAYFGMPDYHDGDLGTFDTQVGLPDGYWSGSSRQVILISNIRDVLYYEPDANVYIAGFYSSTFQNYFDRNVMTIDSLNWEKYLGDPYYRYEGTFAHEYQHLLHADYLAGDETFINEGCSMFAELLTGYPPAYDDIDIFFEEPDNSLTEWGDMGDDYNILADYGQALLFATYMVDQYGDDFLHNYFVNGFPGIIGLEALFPHRITFADVVRDWRLANLIHSDYPEHGRYNYKRIDLNWAISLPEDDPMHVDPIVPFEIPAPKYPHWKYGTDFGETDPFGSTGVYKLGPYGTDYIQIKNMKDLNWIYFSGDSVAEVPPSPEWTMTGYVPFLSEVFGYDYYLPGDGWWWSGTGDLLNVLLLGDVYVDILDPFLRFDTYFDLELEWDYGFVQVSTDDGETWTSLANEWTFIPPVSAAHPDVLANQPGITDWSYYYNGLDPISMEFDMTTYAGQDVMIGFRLVTDWATYYDGWYINNVEVSGIAPVLYTPLIPPVEVDWLVSAVYLDGKGKVLFVWDFFINKYSDYGVTMAYIFGKSDKIILVVTPIMEEGKADYRFTTKKINTKHYFIE